LLIIVIVWNCHIINKFFKISLSLFYKNNVIFKHKGREEGEGKGKGGEGKGREVLIE
jgi:hypothetical protein